MFKATKEIYEAITQAGLSAGIEEINGASVVNIVFALEYSAPVTIRFMSTDDGNDVAMRADLMRAPENRAEDMLALINKLNNKYRYAKFILRGERDVYVEYDFPEKSGALGEGAQELIFHFFNIIRDVQPELLRVAMAVSEETQLN